MAPTPPHQPNACVTMSREEMETIVAIGFPKSTLIDVSSVSTADSFNNRIYFLHLHTDEAEQEVVLKLNGRFFGATKVQNEVACLRQLETHCPRIPCPRVLAWSEDGQTATFHTTGQVDMPPPPPPPPPPAHHAHKHGGWIIMSKLPGVPVPLSELDDESCRDLARQMADMVADWRHNVPAQPLCGNIKLQGLDDTSREEQRKPDGPIVQGIVMDNFEPPEPIRTVNTYQRLRLVEKMRDLANKDTYAPNRHLLALLQKFIDNDLPSMHLAMPTDAGAGLFVFTHYDLAPRNILVSRQPLRITGIVDFEFAGFFHPMEEFLNDELNNNDWPSGLYDAYLQRLEEKGIATPKGSMDREIWKRNCCLERVVNHVAPWWLPGEHGEDLGRELERAGRAVLDGLEGLGWRRD